MRPGECACVCVDQVYDSDNPFHRIEMKVKAHRMLVTNTERIVN